MAGIGVKLNRFFQKRSIAADIAGITYSVFITIAPLLTVMLGIFLMGKIVQIGEASYLQRELFSCTILYVLIFSLLAVAPFDAVLSKYVQDVIYEERYGDVLPCYRLGMGMTLTLGCLLGVPFCLWEHLAGKVDVFYVFMGFCAYMAMILVFYSMIYLLSFKDYEKVSLFFLLGMAGALILSWILRFWCHWEITESMLFSLTCGFLLTAMLEYTAVKKYFRTNSNSYKPILKHCRKWWYLIASNSLYMAGLFVHNFVFWTSDSRRIVADSFFFCPSYDMATCLAIVFTNITATVIFVTHMEMHFRGKYRLYSEAVIGGKKLDIENAKRQMFGQLVNELMHQVRVQFTISVVAYLLCIVLAPQFGLSGSVMRIYPCLAAGFFIVYIMYSAMLFQYYFDDMHGIIMTSATFFAVTLAGSIAVRELPEIWHGMGLTLGALGGWTVTYCRLHWMEKNLDVHIFCRGSIVKRENGIRPSSLVYQRAEEETKENQT